MIGSKGAPLAVSIAAALLTTGEAQASGFALREQSGSMLGQAFAGQNAYTNDPSVIFFNPAGMSALDGTQTSVVTSFIFPKNEFDDDGSTVSPPVILGTDEGGDAGVNAVVPAMYGMTSFGEFRVGVGVNVPFGLKTEYDDDWIGRYAAITSRLKTINVNPVVSYQVTDWLSVGGGAQIQKADARLTNAAFFGAAGDGEIELQADDIGYGFTAGALVTPMDGTQIGIGFRSSVHHDLEGRADVNAPAPVPSSSINASADLDTPETVGLSLYQQLTDRLSLVGTVEWTNWSRFDELRVRFDNGQADSVTEENWDDSYFFALGANYLLTDSLTVRSGVAYDQTPIPDEFRTARLPDEDRYWVALGATYAFSEMISVDVGYTHIFIRHASIEEDFDAAAGPAVVPGTLQGEYENSVDIFVVQANFKV
jgi:long-chain fatty acid transport protein